MLIQPQSVWRSVRGARVAMVFQEPMTALNPVMPVGRQIAEVMVLHQDRLGGKRAHARWAHSKRSASLHRSSARRSYPHQLSGGMRQRVMIAMALACRPALLIADEPTTALDVTIQAQILDLMQALQDEIGMAMQFISHNLAVISEVAHEIVVMYAGRSGRAGARRCVVREPAAPLYARPDRHAAGSVAAHGGPAGDPGRRVGPGRCRGRMPLRRPLRAGGCRVPPGRTATGRSGTGALRGLLQGTPMISSEPVVALEGIRVRFPAGRRTLTAVEGVSLHVDPGETLALVGESGSGKSTIGNVIAGLQRADRRHDALSRAIA